MSILVDIYRADMPSKKDFLYTDSFFLVIEQYIGQFLKSPAQKFSTSDILELVIFEQ